MASIFLSRGYLPLSSLIVSKPKHRFFSPFFDRPRSLSASLPADGNLKRYLQAKITTREAFSIPEDFPFQIMDSDSDSAFIFKRTYLGENIHVEACVNHPDFKEELEGGHEDGCLDDKLSDDDEFYGKVCCTVQIHKGKDRYLEIDAHSTSKGLVVTSMYLKFYSISKGYKGPHHMAPEFDETLQKAALKYVEARGIDLALTKLVEKCGMKKNKELTNWFKDLKIFISK